MKITTLAASIEHWSLSKNPILVTLINLCQRSPWLTGVSNLHWNSNPHYSLFEADGAVSIKFALDPTELCFFILEVNPFASRPSISFVDGLLWAGLYSLLEQGLVTISRRSLSHLPHPIKGSKGLFVNQVWTISSLRSHFSDAAKMPASIPKFTLTWDPSLWIWRENRWAAYQQPWKPLKTGELADYPSHRNERWWSNPEKIAFRPYDPPALLYLRSCLKRSFFLSLRDS